MTSETIVDIRFAILRELYRIDPRGRNVKGLFTMVAPSVPRAQPENVEEQARFLRNQEFIQILKPNELAVSDEPFYVITPKGCIYCETNGLI